MYVQVQYQLVSQCRRTCNQIWTVAHVHAGNYESVRSVNCGVELQRKILETSPCFLFSCFMYCTRSISFRLSRLTTKSYLVVASNHGLTSTHYRLWAPNAAPVRYHVEEVSWRPNPAFCTFDLHEFWSHSTHKICLTSYRVWETSCRIINTLNYWRVYL